MPSKHQQGEAAFGLSTQQSYSTAVASGNVVHSRTFKGPSCLSPVGIGDQRDGSSAQHVSDGNHGFYQGEVLEVKQGDEHPRLASFHCVNGVRFEGAKADTYGSARAVENGGRCILQPEAFFGQRHGSGVHHYLDGSKYVGTFDNDQRSGQGQLIRPNGDEFRGQWERGTLTGFGQESVE
jgi:hypothetical protein